jgi:hypothetical protein
MEFFGYGDGTAQMAKFHILSFWNYDECTPTRSPLLLLCSTSQALADGH